MLQNRLRVDTSARIIGRERHVTVPDAWIEARFAWARQEPRTMCYVQGRVYTRAQRAAEGNQGVRGSGRLGLGWRRGPGSRGRCWERGRGGQERPTRRIGRGGAGRRRRVARRRNDVPMRERNGGQRGRDPLIGRGRGRGQRRRWRQVRTLGLDRLSRRRTGRRQRHRVVLAELEELQADLTVLARAFVVLR